MTRIPLALVEQHVDAVRAIAREHARADLAGVADALTRRLREVTDEFLRVENSDRPDYLESIFAPPLAPGAARSLTGRVLLDHQQAAHPATEAKPPRTVLVLKLFGNELVAEQPRLLARRLGGEAAQQREQRRQIAELLVLAAGQDALDHAPLEPRRAARLADQARPRAWPRSPP